MSDPTKDQTQGVQAEATAAAPAARPQYAQAPAEEKAVTPEGTATGTPEGTTTPGALFDMAPKPEKKDEPKKAAAQAKPAAGRTPAAPTKYPEGTEVRYGRETVHLPKEMTTKEVLDWMAEDDFPELKYEETEVRHDKDKNRLVVVRKAQKKGSAA